MKWPWKERAREAAVARREAEKELAIIKSRWPKVLEVVAETHRHRELNGWSSEIQAIFSGRGR